MARMSAEAKAAAAQKVGGRHPPAPRSISEQAQKIWREIVQSKPVDWFDPGALVLLKRYCVLAADADELEESLLHIGRRDEKAIDELRKSAQALATLSSKLRLSVQAQIDRRDGKITERGAKLNSLLGGNAVSFSDERRKRLGP